MIPCTPVRVLHIMASGEVGGGAAHMLGLLTALQQENVVCMAAVGANGPLQEMLQQQHITTTPINLFGCSIYRNMQHIQRAVDMHAPHMIHCHGTRAAWYAALLKIFHNKLPFIYTIHGLSYRQPRILPIKALAYATEKLICYVANQVISVSQTDIQSLGIDKHAMYLGNAIDTTRFQPGDKMAARALLNIDTQAFLVGVVSRLVPQKSVVSLLDAIMQCPHEMQLIVIGDGPQRASLMQHPAVATKRAVLLGNRHDVHACLPAFDMFALASHWEGEPIALLEAMACGLPCIATRTTGAVELLQHGKYGILVDIGDTKGLTNAMQDIRNNNLLRQQLSHAGYAYVQHRTYQHMAQHIKQMYTLQTGLS